MGIGQAIAARLAEAGAGVLVADHDGAAAAEAVAAITASGGRAIAHTADVARIGDAEGAMELAHASFGQLDILVNNAGVFPMRPALEIDEALWDHVLDVNLKGAFFWAQAAARTMIASGAGGSIVNIASIDALHPTGALAHYDASKAGRVMLSQSLALEFGVHGIRVNAIAPGGIDTPGVRALSAPAPGAPPPDLSSFLNRIPLRRMGVPDDIALAALFCASDMSRYMTGTLNVLDGGYLLS